MEFFDNISSPMDILISKHDYIGVEILEKLAEYTWDVFTLKHVKHKQFVFSYLLFLSLLLLFEIFLVGLFIFSSIVFIHFKFVPNFIFFISGAILTIIMIATVPAFLQLIKKWQQCK